MPKCQKCYNYFPVDYSVIADEKSGDCICVFCKTDKKTITIVDKNNLETIVTKKYVIYEYEKYIKKLYQSKSIQDVINKK